MGLKLVGRTQIAHSATSLARRIGVISFGLALGDRRHRPIAFTGTGDVGRPRRRILTTI